MANAKLNDVRIHYEQTGSGEVPVVLVHGSWGSLHHWDRVIPALGRSFRVTAYDRRGHGESEAPPGQGSVHEDVADLAALIESLGIAPAWVVANSFGSNITLRLAGERPDLFRGVVAHEPPLFGLLATDPETAPMLSGLVETVGTVAQRLEAERWAEATRAFMAMALAPGEWDRVPAEFQKIAIANAPTFADEIKDADALSIDLASLGAFTKPTLVTVGDQSPPHYAAIVRKLAGALPQAETPTWAGRGHLPHVTHPDPYVDAVSTFVREHS